MSRARVRIARGNAHATSRTVATTSATKCLRRRTGRLELFLESREWSRDERHLVNTNAHFAPPGEQGPRELSWALRHACAQCESGQPYPHRRHQYGGKVDNVVVPRREVAIAAAADPPRVGRTHERDHGNRQSRAHRAAPAARFQAHHQDARMDVGVRRCAYGAPGTARRFEHLGEAMIVHVPVGALARRLTWRWFALGANEALGCIFLVHHARCRGAHARVGGGRRNNCALSHEPARVAKFMWQQIACTARRRNWSPKSGR